jgi:hypothetical protein
LRIDFFAVMENQWVFGLKFSKKLGWGKLIYWPYFLMIEAPIFERIEAQVRVYLSKTRKVWQSPNQRHPNPNNSKLNILCTSKANIQLSLKNFKMIRSAIFVRLMNA